MPGLRDSIVTRTAMTPYDFEHTLRSVDGAAFGPEPLLTQSAWFRYHNRAPDLQGLYFVGAGTHPGAGVPGVLSSARVLDRVVPAPDVPVPLTGPSAPASSYLIPIPTTDSSSPSPRGPHEDPRHPSYEGQ